jgi:hypothetical protein
MPTQCQHCGSQLEEGAVVCVHCGQATSAPAPPADSETVPVAALAEPQEHTGGTLFASARDSADRDLHGIGGWLIFPAIGLAISPFLSLHGVYSDSNVLFGAEFQNALTERPGLVPLLVFELATNMIFFCGSIALNVLLYKRKKAFPASMITFLAGQMVLLFIDHLWAAQFHTVGDPTGLVRSVVGCLIWIPYFLRSRRVEITFVD